MKKITILLVLLLMVAVSSELMAQCAMCRGTVESTISGGRSVVASQLNVGILYLLAAPYLIISTIAFLWYRNSKKEHGKRIEIAGRLRRALSQM